MSEFNIPKVKPHERLKPRRPKNEYGKQFDYVKRYGCLICHRPAQIHHLNTVERTDERILPLCAEHHLATYPESIHAMGHYEFETWHGYERGALEKRAEQYWHKGPQR